MLPLHYLYIAIERWIRTITSRFVVDNQFLAYRFKNILQSS